MRKKRHFVPNTAGTTMISFWADEFLEEHRIIAWGIDEDEEGECDPWPVTIEIHSPVYCLKDDYGDRQIYCFPSYEDRFETFPEAVAVGNGRYVEYMKLQEVIRQRREAKATAR